MAANSTAVAAVRRGSSISATRSTPNCPWGSSSSGTAVLASRRSRHCRTRAATSRRYVSPSPGMEFSRVSGIPINSPTVATSSRAVTADTARADKPASPSGVMSAARAA